MEARKNVNNTNRFLVTEYCKGGSLKDGIVTRSKVLRKDMKCSTTIATWMERLGWALDIASALSYLKKHELYHGRFFVYLFSPIVIFFSPTFETVFEYDFFWRVCFSYISLT